MVQVSNKDHLGPPVLYDYFSEGVGLMEETLAECSRRVKYPKNPANSPLVAMRGIDGVIRTLTPLRAA